jgi:hypothetical protein
LWASRPVLEPKQPPGISSPPSAISSELEDELRAAADDFERGDYIELSSEQLERCIANGESPWPDESRG